MTTREFFALLNRLRRLDVVGGDIGCFCPPLDTPGQITALTVSELMLHMVSHVADYRVHGAAGSVASANGSAAAPRT